MLKEAAGKIWKTLPNVVRLRIIRTTQRKFTVSVGAVVTNDRGEILLLDHVLRPAGGWGIPGGFMNHGEQPEETARREIMEETGLRIENTEIIRARTINRHIEILVRAEANGEPAVKSREIKAAGWFTLDRMPAGISRIHKELIEKIVKSKD